MPVHWSSDRRPFQVTGTTTGWPLRTTTLAVGMAFGQSWLDQILSLPEAILTTMLSGDTAKVHAGWVPVSWSSMATGVPAQARGTDGTTLTSSAAQSPLGGSRGTWAFARTLIDGATGPMLDGAAEAFVEVLLPVVTAWLPAASDPVPPRSFPIPKTSSSATAITTLRRTQ